ncbi:uncharacterized protein LOC129565714 [Sitodiplosis mosellana]|uniref:uncharacterized protein LOC129565714 n=1 Tax=Sitodiplosis mosellana TaxID=263140 RepID=UPI002443A246|nr:uncharacterized protein LOC129565714 [Sitodiplosis mosellana]
MAESDLLEIPSNVIRAALRETIEKKIKSKNHKIFINSASQAGENNFSGILYRVSFNKDGEDKHEQLILKIAPHNAARRVFGLQEFVFLREIYMYNEFEESKGIILEENGFTEYPICYRTVDEEPSESVLLEDLSVRDFRIIDRNTEEITADHVRLVMQALKESQRVLNPLSDEEDAHLVAKVKKLFEKHPMDIAADCLEVELTGAATVISHGDTWQNNTMLRYDKNEKPIEIRLLDWQISRHSSPIIDIAYYIFSCTTKELRDAHYDDFLNINYESLSAYIRRLGSEPEKLFPYALMLEHFRKFAKFGLFMGVMCLPLLKSEKGNAIDLDGYSEGVVTPKIFSYDIFHPNQSQLLLPTSNDFLQRIHRTEFCG